MSISTTMQPAFYTGYQGVRLAADVGGDPSAPPVILLHGGGQTRHSWGKAARELLAAGYHVLTLDLRGHGDSQWAPDGDYSMNAFVGDLLAVVRTLRRAPALVGASLGGATSMIAVGEADGPVASALVLVDVVPRMEQQGIARIRNFMRGNPDGFANLDEAAAAVTAYNPTRPRPASNAGLMKNLRRGADGRLYWHWDPAFQNGRSDRGTGAVYDRMDAAAARIRIPTLLVRGKASEVVSEAGARHLHGLMPHADTVDVEGAGHMVAGDKNDAFNGAVLGFLGRTLGSRHAA
ncbi:alpha/beta fold hydrolase [Massilia putida]|uniref:alpha/beta fold hydrolase n=1 Tax=Massilia putida TaxID=1141883 RepID=UPI000952B482|nr:alpha/beta hydrolase [Massilia putida]